MLQIRNGYDEENASRVIILYFSIMSNVVFSNPPSRKNTKCRPAYLFNLISLPFYYSASVTFGYKNKWLVFLLNILYFLHIPNGNFFTRRLRNNVFLTYNNYTSGLLSLLYGNVFFLLPLRDRSFIFLINLYISLLYLFIYFWSLCLFSLLNFSVDNHPYSQM